MKSITFLLGAVFTLCAWMTQGQNTYNPYKDYNGQSVTLVDPNRCGNILGQYSGEYQLFLSEHHWFTDPVLATYAKSYRIEVVSFPFSPECDNGDCGNPNSVTRELIIPDNTTPTGWSHFFPNAANYTAQISRMIYDEYPTSNSLMGGEFALASRFLNFAGTVADTRVFFPHTALKHTFYIHAGTSSTAPIVDSFSFVLDHTRGAMKRYPWRGDNRQTLAAEHDVTIFPGVHFSANEYYNGQSINFLNTLDYYPLTDHSLPSFTANDLLVPEFMPSPVQYGDPASSFIHPPPFALLNIRLGSEPGGELAGYSSSCNGNTYTNTALNTGPYHHYTIDKPFDLTTINNFEKVIYNPSSVDIQLPLANNTQIFPTGYTFKTIMGLYPTANDVVNSPFNGPNYPDLRNVPVSSVATLEDDPNTLEDERISYYYIKNGSVLLIEPCVTIYDAIIVVESGGTLIYDSLRTYGNFVIDGTATGAIVINQPDVNNTLCTQNCNLPEFYDEPNPITISGNTFWDLSTLSSMYPSAVGPIRMGNDIVIPQGAVLTIDAGVRLEFSPSSRILVEQGGQLKLLGTVSKPVILTSACNLLWEGIVVHGNASLNQANLANQGYVYSNFANIENAQTGILVGDFIDPSKNGGILHIDNSSFSNNSKDIDYLSYYNTSSVLWLNWPINNVSRITQSRFETTRPIYGASSSYPLVHIQLRKTFGIYFAGNKVINTLPTAFRADQRGLGILLQDAGLVLENGCLVSSSSGCSVYEYNEFENLSEGIRAFTTGIAAFRYISIDGNRFKKNVHGIVLEDQYYSEISRNTFEVPISAIDANLDLMPGLRSFNKPVGVYLLNSSYFGVDENIFNLNAPPTMPLENTCEHCSYGIVVNNAALPDLMTDNAGYGYARVYGNKLKNLSIAIQSEMDNEGLNGYVNIANGGTGLEIKCNEIGNSQVTDIHATGSVFPATNLPGKLRIQGYYSITDIHAPASNVFNTYCDPNNPLTNHFLLTNHGGVDYYHHVGPINTYPICNNGLSLYSVPFTMNGLTCPSRFPMDDDGGDGGNPTLLVQELLEDYQMLFEGQLSQEAWSRPFNSGHEGIGTKASYLTDVAILSILNQENRVSEDQLVAILKTNAPLSESILQAFKKLPWVSSETIRQVEENQHLHSEKSRFLEKLDHALLNHHLTRADKIRKALKNNDLVTAISYVQHDTSNVSRQELLLLTMGHWDQTYKNSVLELISSNHEFQKGWYAQYLASVIEPAPLETKIATNVNSRMETNDLQDRYPGLTIARHLSEMYTGTVTYTLPFDLPLNRNYDGPKDQSVNAKSNISEEVLIYPNPCFSGDHVTIEWNENLQLEHIIVSDITGRLLHLQSVEKDKRKIALELNLQAGVYILSFSNHNGSLQSLKLILLEH